MVSSVIVVQAGGGCALTSTDQTTLW